MGGTTLRTHEGASGQFHRASKSNAKWQEVWIPLQCTDIVCCSASVCRLRFGRLNIAETLQSGILKISRQLLSMAISCDQPPRSEAAYLISVC